jgi:hypothetical protein
MLSVGQLMDILGGIERTLLLGEASAEALTLVDEDSTPVATVDLEDGTITYIR